MRVVTFLLTLAMYGTALAGQRVPLPAYRARVLGVFDDATGDPLDSVRVSDVLNGNSSLTTRTGTVALYFLPDGGGLVRLQKIGYEVQTLAVAISPSDTNPVTITLRRVTKLPRVLTTAQTPTYISPALRGFEERRHSAATGYFVADSVLRANESQPLSELLSSRMPNMWFAGGFSGARFLMRSARCAAGGPPQVYLDGVAMSPELRPDAPGARYYNMPKRTIFGAPIPGADKQNEDVIEFNLSQFDVTNLAGVEWYPDSDMLPIEFNHTSGRCGALMLWTRER